MVRGFLLGAGSDGGFGGGDSTFCFPEIEAAWASVLKFRLCVECLSG